MGGAVTFQLLGRVGGGKEVIEERIWDTFHTKVPMGNLYLWLVEYK